MGIRCSAAAHASWFSSQQRCSTAACTLCHSFCGHPVCHASPQWVKLRGLPFQSRESEIWDFFSKAQVRHLSHITARMFHCNYTASQSLSGLGVWVKELLTITSIRSPLLPCASLLGREKRSLRWQTLRPPGKFLVTRHTSHVTRHTSYVTRHTSHVTRHTSHVTRHTSHVTRHTSHVTRHTSHVTPHTSHVTRHTSHVTRRTSHLTPHTSHVTRHTSHVTRHTSHVARRLALSLHKQSFAGPGSRYIEVFSLPRCVDLSRVMPVVSSHAFMCCDSGRRRSRGFGGN
jgi:hypothetical protein